MKKLLLSILFAASLFSNCKKVNPLVIDDLVIVGADLPDGKPMRSDGTIQIAAVASDGIGVDKGKIVLEAGEGTWVQEWDKGSDFITFKFRSGCRVGIETLVFKAYEFGATVPKKTLEVSFNVADVSDEDWIRPCIGRLQPKGPLARAANGDLWARNSNVPHLKRASSFAALETAV